MQVFHCEQGSQEWHALRRGIPTASEFPKIITAKTVKVSAQADDYICELIGELHSQFLPDWYQSYTSRHMAWGSESEAEARRWYGAFCDCDVEEVGFCLADGGKYGCSPDGLIGADGGLELKCPAMKTHVKYLLNGEVLPDEYKAQVHGNLLVTGRAWWDFLSYAPGLPPLIIRVTPNDFTKKLHAALGVFLTLFETRLARIRDGSWQQKSMTSDDKLRKALEDSVQLETEKAWAEWREKHGVQATLPFPEGK